MSGSLVDRAALLGAGIRGEAQRIEDLGRLPDDVVASLVDTDAMRMFVPTDLGGPALDVPTGMRVIEEFGRHDGAVGWCVAIAATTSMLASYLPDPFAEAIYGDARAVTGGFAAPVGRAEAVDGGLRVSGRWAWGSGITHCTWIGGGVMADDGPRFVFFEPEQVELLGGWDVAGLRGTGSVDYAVSDAFVPTGRGARLGVDRPTRPGPITTFSQFGLLASGIAATSLGIAERSIEELVILAAAKRPQGSRRVLADRSATQAEVARADGQLRAARALFHDAIGTAWERAVDGDAGDDDRVAIRLAAVHAAQTAVAVTSAMFGLGGGAAIHRTSALQRCWRDAAVAAQHAMVAPRVLEPLGRVRLGLETELRQL